jgi:pimeloyl-ACP methyl ester carboxylesterase
MDGMPERPARKIGNLRILAGLLGAMTFAAAAPVSAQLATEARPEIIKIDGPIAGLKLGLLHYAAPHSGAPIVLALHGQILPHEANMGFPIGGRSLLRSLADTGLDVWALDYYGFGASDRYPEMNEPANAHPPLGPKEEVADQVAAAVKFLRTRNGDKPIALFGDSRGTAIAGVYASRQPGTLSKLILYGPVTPFTDGTGPPIIPSYTTWTPKDLWSIFSAWAEKNPGPGTLDQSIYEGWASAMIDSDPTSRTRNPPSIKIPNGGALDSAALPKGQYIFDPSAINVPTLLIMGETDEIASLAGAQWLLSHLRNAPHRRLVVLGNGSHTTQFESERPELYRVLAEFLHEKDQ